MRKRALTINVTVHEQKRVREVSNSKRKERRRDKDVEEK